MNAVPPLLRVVVVGFVALVLHVAVFSHLRVAGVMPEVFVLLVGATTLLGNAERAATVGIAFGLLHDLVLETPFGMSALSFALVGYAVARVQFPLSRVTWWIPVVVTAFVTAMAMSTYLIFGWIFGQEALFGGSLVRPVLVASAINACLAWPAFRLMHAALDDGQLGYRISTAPPVRGRAR